MSCHGVIRPGYRGAGGRFTAHSSTRYGGVVCVCGNVTGRDMEHKQPQCDASHNLILAIINLLQCLVARITWGL